MTNVIQMVNRFEFCLLIGFLVIFKNVSNTIEHDYMDIHRPEKQMSLETCLGQFEVHSNTIIRTGESQAIGGKFLQGLELETVDKCQRLCCETSNCDVYVFEEKIDKYCYLFQCGSPKNFHCKFTRHPNYTSALITQYSKSVPTTTPRPVVHAFLPNISTQEQELISLKLKPDKNVPSSTSQPFETATSENRIMTATATENRNLTCGRFEFPCHSGECIAIYNACNGIPQCVDGSDEGPECSAATSYIKTNEHHLQNLKSEISEQKPTYSHNLKKFQQVALDIPYNGDREVPGSAPTAWANQKVQADMQSDSDRTTFGRKNNMQNSVNSIINLDEPIEKTFPNQREMYAQLPAIKSSFPTPQLAQPTAHVFVSNVRWPLQRQQWQIENQGQGPPYEMHEQPHNVHPDQNQIHSPDEEAINAGSHTTNDNSSPKEKSQDSINHQDKIQDDTEYSEKTVDTLKKEPVETKPEVTKTTHSVKDATHASAVEQYKIIEQNLEIKFTDHDGQSERPRGAVLSLTLGLLVTGIIVVLVGCRLRTVGRRGNRHGGKASYAPDEDFLVNGMYL